MSLTDKLNQTSNVSRLNAIDAAFFGNPYGGSNFIAKWQGYNDDGISVVKYLDQTYTGVNLAATYTRKNTDVLLRVAEGYRSLMY